MRTPVFMLALLAVVFLPRFDVSLGPAQSVQPESPRINALKSQLALTGDAAIDAFWREVAQQGAPLVEPLAGWRAIDSLRSCGKVKRTPRTF